MGVSGELWQHSLFSGSLELQQLLAVCNLRKLFPAHIKAVCARPCVHSVQYTAKDSREALGVFLEFFLLAASSPVPCPTNSCPVYQPDLSFLFPAAFCLDSASLSCSLKSTPRQKAKKDVELISCVSLLSRISYALLVAPYLKTVTSNFCPGVYLLVSIYP